MNSSRTLWGSWAQKSFHVPCTSLSMSPVSYLYEIGFLQPPWPSLSSKGQVQIVANQSSEGMRRQGRSSQDTRGQPWNRVLVPPQGYLTIPIFELFCRTKAPTKWKMLTTWWSILHSREKVTEAHHKTTWRHMTSGLKECRPCRHPDPYQQPCPSTIILSTNPPGLGHTVLRALARLCLEKQ